MKLFKTGDTVIVRGLVGILGNIDAGSTHVDVMFEYLPQGCYSTINVPKSEVELFIGKQNSPYKECLYETAMKINKNSTYGMYGSSIDKCNHHFVRYTGLRETYLFCKICDLKKEN